MSKPPSLRPFLDGLHAYAPGEQPGGLDVVKLNTNENPYPPPDLVVEEVRAAAEEHLRLYPNPTSENLRRALAAYHGLDPEQILVGNGSDEILRLLVHACVGRGEAVAVVEPSYSLYPVLAASFEGRVETYPLEERERLPESLFQGGERLLLLPNPNPPLGTFFGRAEIARLCAERPNTLVVVDEAYVDFAPRDAVPLMFEYPNLAVSRTFSKSFSLAGMRVGYLLAHAEIVAQIGKLKDSYNVNHLSQIAAAAAIASFDSMRENADRIIATRKRTVEWLEALGFRVPPSHGNFVFAIHERAEECFRALRKRRILVRRFDVPGLRDGLRITIGTPKQMAALVEALKQILA